MPCDGPREVTVPVRRARRFGRYSATRCPALSGWPYPRTVGAVAGVFVRSGETDLRAVWRASEAQFVPLTYAANAPIFTASSLALRRWDGLLDSVSSKTIRRAYPL